MVCWFSLWPAPVTERWRPQDIHASALVKTWYNRREESNAIRMAVCGKQNNGTCTATAQGDDHDNGQA